LEDHETIPHQSTSLDFERLSLKNHGLLPYLPGDSKTRFGMNRRFQKSSSNDPRGHITRPSKPGLKRPIFLCSSVPTSPAGYITGGNDEPGEPYHEPWCTHQKLGIPASPASPASENAMFGLERIEAGSLEEERRIQARNEVDTTKQTISTTIDGSAYTSTSCGSHCRRRFSAVL